jgi:hypothetical protein
LPRDGRRGGWEAKPVRGKLGVEPRDPFDVDVLKTDEARTPPLPVLVLVPGERCRPTGKGRSDAVDDECEAVLGPVGFRA